MHPTKPSARSYLKIKVTASTQLLSIPASFLVPSKTTQAMSGSFGTYCGHKTLEALSQGHHQFIMMALWDHDKSFI
jgi:hypothetical protein